MKSDRSRIAVAVAAVLVLTAIFMLRRPDQVLHPYVWVEESIVLNRYVSHGWLAAFEPLRGYLIMPTSPLIVLSAAISFVHLPRIEWLFDVFLFLATVLILLLPSSRWGTTWIRIAMAAAVVVVPVGPEVFGVLLLSFWWASLWPVIVLGWESSLWPVRVPILAVAALSSPAGGALFVVFVVSYWVDRRRHDLVSGAILFAGFCMQAVLAASFGRRPRTLVHTLTGMVVDPGRYEAPWLPHGIPVVLGGILVCVLMAAGAWWAWRKGSHEPALLTCTALVLGAITSSAEGGNATATRFGVILNGRYLFLPFVLFAWTALSYLRFEVVHDRHRIALRAVACALLAAPLANLPANLMPTVPATKANLSWPHELVLCARDKLRPRDEVPVYGDSWKFRRWSVTLTPSQCSAFVSGTDAPTGHRWCRSRPTAVTPNGGRLGSSPLAECTDAVHSGRWVIR